MQSFTISDGLGRQIESRQYETGTQYIATTKSYDALGRISATTNPTRGTSPNTNDGLGYTTRTFYDALDRVTQIVAADGSAMNTTYAGNQTTVTDSAGKQRSTFVDSTGRIVQIIEDPGSGSHLNYLTTYAYDPLNNLLSVTQSGQVRSFVYDGLSRLKQATNPESGTVSYTYDAVGNLLTKTDARGVVTCFGSVSGTACDNSGYDDLNRVVRKSFSDGTPAVTYSYDVGGGLFTGRLTSVANANSTTNYTSYDALGHVLGSTQLTQGQGYGFSYVYNAAGSLTAEQYPSGRMVQTGYDAAGRPAWLQGNRAGALTNYIANPNDANAWIHYWPHGAVYYYGLGNGITHAVSFNPRLQQTESYEAIDNDSGKMLFVSCPNWGNSSNPGVYDVCPHPAATANNGNLAGYDEYHGGAGYPQLLSFHQSFTYDGANRLQTAADTGGWSRTFNYDPFGNLWVSNVTGPATGAYSSNVYDTNNRVMNTSYDAAGNLSNVNGNTLSYDAENRQVTVTELPVYGGGTEQYRYDGNGQRVAKSGPSGTTVYIYDAAGQLAAEYSTAVPAASSCSTCYLSTDHLGTTRLVTDGNATVIARHDFFPFGEEIPAGQAGRDAHFGSGNDSVNQKFTGKERDGETGLDYFGARYYGSALGRFTSPDPESASASLFDPQRWNAYSYAVNNPYKFVDPDGENPLLISGGVGLVVGAVGGALFDVGNQLIQNGGHFDHINGQEVLGATVGGAVSGGLAGLTLGLIPAPATLTAGYLATSAVVNGGSNVVGGIVQREIDSTASNTKTTDFVAGAVGGAAGTKVAYVRYPLPNVKKELEAISFFNRRSLRPGKVASLNARAASQSTKNIVTNSVFATSVANFFSTLWLDLTHSSSPKACVEAHDSHGNGTGQTCSN